MVDHIHIPNSHIMYTFFVQCTHTFIYVYIIIYIYTPKPSYSLSSETRPQRHWACLASASMIEGHSLAIDHPKRHLWISQWKHHKLTNLGTSKSASAKFWKQHWDHVSWLDSMEFQYISFESISGKTKLDAAFSCEFIKLAEISSLFLATWAPLHTAGSSGNWATALSRPAIWKECVCAPFSMQKRTWYFLHIPCQDQSCNELVAQTNIICKYITYCIISNNTV